VPVLTKMGTGLKNTPQHFFSRLNVIKLFSSQKIIRQNKLECQVFPGKFDEPIQVKTTKTVSKLYTQTWNKLEKSLTGTNLFILLNY
jgi:hypothetical protein